MNQLIEELKKFGIEEGFNNHEEMAYNAGYFDKDKYFPKYLDLKLKLLKARDNATTDEKRKFFNALRIYIYSIWENLWYGYLMSYSELHVSYFLVNGKHQSFLYPYLNHLPSFSSAILHFGSCRDLFCALLKIWVDKNNNQCIYDSITTHDYMGKKGQERFKDDLKQISTDCQYSNEGMQVFKNNEFRNFFAHRLRVLWWHNKRCSPIEYFIKKNVFEDIKKRKEGECKRYVLAMLDDEKAYKHNIEKSDRSELIGSGEILRETHDIIATFLNKTLGFMIEKI